MAESQVPYCYEQTTNELVANLSDKRFKPYLINAGFKKEFAFALYLYNARMAKSFLYPLHVLEVTLRNRIHSVFRTQFSDNWCHDKYFRSILSSESRNVLDMGIDRANTHDVEDVVSTLSFDFWSNLFRPEYDRDIWQNLMVKLLPSQNITRKEFQKRVKLLNNFRNRIAHHEPIHKLDLSELHKVILETLQWISPEMSVWVKHFSTVNSSLRTRPHLNANDTVSYKTTSDNNFIQVSPEDNIDIDFSRRFIVCLNQDDLVAVIEKQHIADFLYSLRNNGELLISLREYTFSDVINYSSLKLNALRCPPTLNITHVSSLLKKKVMYIVIQQDKQIHGVIAKAHRKY
nr:Abi family protein [Pantoea cypripedii]